MHSGTEYGPEIPVCWIRTSILIAILVTFTSICGIFLPATYAREVPLWAIQAVGQDFANLVVAFLLPGCTYLASRRSLGGYLVWLGLLLYLVYAFAIYSFALHFQFLFPLYVAVLGLSGFTLAGALLAADRGLVAQALQNNPAMNPAAILLAGISLLFGALWLSGIVPHIFAGTVPADITRLHLLVNPVHVLDLAFVLPGMMATAFLIWQDKPAGYLTAVPLLVFSATMGLGILAMNLLSIPAGLPNSVPAIGMVSLIVMGSVVITYWCLSELPDNVR